MKMLNQKGQAAILTIFVLGMIALLIALSRVKLGSLESFRGRSTARSLQAYYSANSGIEDAIKRIEQGAGNGTANLSIGGETNNIKVTISGGSDNKIITSVAKNGPFVRRIRSSVTKVGGFSYAIQAGNGGLEMENQTDVDGNVYSNSDIKGKNNDYQGGKCKNSSSRINGNAEAIGKLDKLAPSDKGVCVENIATASSFLYCRIGTTAYDPNFSDTINSSDCPHANHSQNTPSVVSLPELDESGSFTTISGDCIADGSVSSCAGTTNTLGNVIIDGNLTISPPSGAEFFFSGPVKVTGNLKFKGFNNNNKVGLTTGASGSGIFVNVIVNGKITSETGNVTFCRDNPADCTTGTKYLLFASKYTSPGPDMCTDPAIDLHSNTSSILFYGKNGCVTISSGGPGDTFFGAVLGQKVHLSPNVNIRYDPNLGNSSSSGSWRITSFEEY